MSKATDLKSPHNSGTQRDNHQPNQFKTREARGSDDGITSSKVIVPTESDGQRRQFDTQPATSGPFMVPKIRHEGPDGQGRPLKNVDDSSPGTGGMFGKSYDPAKQKVGKH